MASHHAQPTEPTEPNGPTGATAPAVPPMPDNEERRLEALHECRVFDPGTDQSFDNIARLAARLCDTPVAMVNLVEKHRLWIKHGFGIAAPAYVPRHESFCAHAILDDDTLVVEDATKDPRFSGNAFVTCTDGIRFYIGVPLTLETGERLGTLSVVDTVPRSMTGAMHDDLLVLASQVVALLELRKKTFQLGATRDELRLILDAVPAYVYFKDDENNILNLNRAAAEAMHMSVADVTGRHTEDFFPAEDAADFLRDDRDVISSGRPKLGIEEYHEGGQGERRLIRTDKYPMQTLNGEPRLVAIATDITELRHSQQELERSRRLLSAVMNGGPSVIYAKDTDDRYMMINNRFAEAMEKPIDEIVGLKDHDLFPEEIADTIVANDRMVRETGEFAELDEEAVVDGEHRHFISSKFPLIDADGNTYGTAGISTDVTQMYQLRKELESKNRELERFVYTASHDLKSPIVTINGYLSHLKHDLDNNKTDELPEYAMRIERAAARMQKNIDELLELSRIGRVTSERRHVEVAPLLAEIIDEHKMAIDEHGVAIRTELDTSAIWIDPQHLDQILRNLISNAFKYGVGNESPEIVVRSSATPQGWVTLSVEDNGVGVDSKHAELVFDLFQKLSNDKQSSGIGLSIVRRVAELYDARVWVEASARGGACFKVSFPERAVAAS